MPDSPEAPGPLDGADTPSTSRPPEHELFALGPRSLRGLAHPLRMRLLNSLRHHGPATASQLADRLNESSGATSYHLRQLATYGFIEDDPERGKGRERWWKSVHQGLTFDDSLILDPDPEVRGAVDMYLHEVANLHTQELSTWLGTRHEWSERWARNSDLSNYTLRLTPELAAELDRKMHELISGYRDRAPAEDAAEAEEAAQVRLHLHMFPRSTD
ncbi:helix-turn-helix domain-containing protein [Streptomyces sp. NPDC006923]|uniref:ArsR/SmtB family transcription factor n=1 Tax=Streptomyces sp. NPDC006923 TaxID=3155355 RepID=UPI0033C37E43